MANEAQQLGIGCVATGDGDVVQESWEAQVQRGEAVAAGLMGERAGEPGLPHAARSGDEDVEVLAQPAPASEGEDEGLVESAGVAEVDVLDAGVGMAPASRGAVDWSCADRRARWFRGRRAGRDVPRTRVHRRRWIGVARSARWPMPKALELVEFVDDGMGQHGEGLRDSQRKYDGPRRLSWSSGKGHSGASCRGCSSRRCFKMDSTRTHRARPQGEGALGGGFEPGIGVGLGQAQDAEAGAVALFGMTPGLEGRE